MVPCGTSIMFSTTVWFIEAILLACYHGIRALQFFLSDTLTAISDDAP